MNHLSTFKIKHQTMANPNCSPTDDNDVKTEYGFVVSNGCRIQAPRTQDKIPDFYTVSDRNNLELSNWIMWLLMEQGIPVPVLFSKTTSPSLPKVVYTTFTSDFSAEIDMLGRKVRVCIERNILKTPNCGPYEVTEVTLTIPANGDTYCSLLMKINAEIQANYKLRQKIHTQPSKTISVYDWDILNKQWTSSNSIGSRTWDSIAIDAEVLRQIRADVSMYWRLRKSKVFDNIGRRIYLLHGPPGSGKTSLSQAIATQMKARIYRIRASTTDSDLAKAVGSANKSTTSVFLIEDADELFADQGGDIAGVGQYAEKNTDIQYVGVSKSAPKMDATKSKLTFSGVLNALDGTDAPAEGIIILSSNRAHSYDQALLRRINRSWHIAGVSAATVKQYLQHHLKVEPTAALCEDIANKMNKQGLQMVVLRECCVRALYAKNEAAAAAADAADADADTNSDVDTNSDADADVGILHPTPDDVYEQLCKFKKLSHTNLLEATQKPTSYIG